MAIRFQAPKLLKNLRYFTRALNSASTTSISAVSPLNFDEKPEPTIEKPAANRLGSSVLDINDHEKLFSLLSTTKLIRAAANLHLAAVEPLVDFGVWVMNSRLMDIDLAREVVMCTVRHSFYEHFCAGENAPEATDCVRRVNDAGLRGMLVYAVEHTDDVSECEQNLQGFLQTVQSAKSLPPESASFVIAKISAICPMSLLQRVSDLLRWQQRDPSFNLPWKLNNFPLFSDCSPLYHTLQKPEPLTLQEENELQSAHQRLQKLCQECLEANVPLTVDAEDTFVQPAIDYLTYNAALSNNKAGKPIVYNTIQAYLKDAKERLFLATEAAEKMGVPMGFKLVRGAYMSSESKLAASLGFDSPIHNSIQETHACYNDCASYMLEKIADGSGAVVLATHNVESGQLAAAKATDLGIKGDQKLEFAQLYGMAEALSYGLRNAGFQVSKYMPFGPVDKIIPYLLRRAEENRGFLSASNLDRQLMRKELMRRVNAAVM
ncbi:proline dehydrogenase 1 [Citrus sinensis]|uniref:Proline dehydrogenase n=2 Tax=Citrus TaxID=2706 RepID=A0A067EUQ2_CITSI|nr:proline dehydrogenase 2, mitochondrial [Citrus sinensis]KAH9675932.1 proline dehydrogenase 1 [Citrus sinensis]KDO58889.1 hypothetical protein CISIN_1g042033mg [Citrus sinensis]GAY46235.1 hypothetical protein CUMW_095420 [Citrus unshiu]